jgi:hypothetical protein
MSGIPTEVARKALRAMEQADNELIRYHCDKVSREDHNIINGCGCPTAVTIRELQAAKECVRRAILLAPGPKDEEAPDDRTQPSDTRA